MDHLGRSSQLHSPSPGLGLCLISSGEVLRSLDGDFFWEVLSCVLIIVLVQSQPQLWLRAIFQCELLVLSSHLVWSLGPPACPLLVSCELLVDLEDPAPDDGEDEADEEEEADGDPVLH